jgi:hypothetical protein
MSINVRIKKCSKCGTHKQLHEFHRKKANCANGRVDKCKECMKEVNATNREMRKLYYTNPIF